MTPKTHEKKEPALNPLALTDLLPPGNRDRGQKIERFHKAAQMNHCKLIYVHKNIASDPMFEHITLAFPFYNDLESKIS
jgi:hypothetical protein